jgi:hypothetical protein
MLNTNAKPERSWHEIAAKVAMASREHNLERLADLRKELECVLDHRNNAFRARATSDKNLPARDKTA